MGQEYSDDSHEQVSRTTSDTLGQEDSPFSVDTFGFTRIHLQQQQSQPNQHQQCQQQQQHQRADRSPSYTQRVEFALKLGYTERLVQAALARLGPNPAQNELLAELIKLGAQQCNKGELCDPTIDCALINSQDNSGMKDPHHNPHLHQHHLHNHDDHELQFNNSNSNNSSNNRPSLLRPIVIDGSNVAMSHGNKESFSCMGIKICVDWFKNRGHKDITVFVPKYRKESCRPDHPIKDQEILNELEKERLLVFTPSRLVGGKRTVCYDDRYVLKVRVD